MSGQDPSERTNKPGKQTRLAQALRANLQKRKKQQRGREPDADNASQTRAALTPKSR